MISKIGKDKEFIKEHLSYEIDMLRSVSLLLIRQGKEWAVQNAFIESFCIHSLNLLEFFCKDKNAWPVTDFCDVSYRPMPRPQSLLMRISNQIAHLGQNRTSDIAKKINAADPTILQMIENEIERFSQHLKP